MAIFVPEIFRDILNEKLGKKLVVTNLATDYTDEVEDITTCGKSVVFPSLSRNVEAVEVDPDNPLDPTGISMSKVEADIKEVAAPGKIRFSELKQIKGNVKDRYIEQVADALVVKVDGDLMDAIRTDATYKDSTLSGLTEDDLLDAIGCFGDQADVEDMAGIVCHSRLKRYFYSMPSFIKSTNTMAKDGNGIQRRGYFGDFSGIPCFVSDNHTLNSNKYMLAVIKKDALGIAWQKMPEIKEQDDLLNSCTNIVAYEMYAPLLADESGVSVLESTASPN